MFSGAFLLIDAQFHLVHTHDICGLDVRRAHLFHLDRRLNAHPFEDGNRLLTVRHAAIDLVLGERDACTQNVLHHVVVELIGFAFRVEEEVIPRPVVVPVVEADADGDPAIGEIKGPAGMQARIDVVDALAGAEGIRNHLIGHFFCRHVGGDTREGEIEQVVDGALPVFDRCRLRWCFQPAHATLCD